MYFHADLIGRKHFYGGLVFSDFFRINGYKFVIDWTRLTSESAFDYPIAQSGYFDSDLSTELFLGLTASSPGFYQR
nr:hypothetical protein [Xanthocytophaga agilis]